MKHGKKGHETHDKRKESPEEGATAAPAAEAGKAPETPAPAGAETGGVAAAQAAPAPPLTEEQQLKDRLLRLQADFENYRKRNVREKMETIRRANEDLLLALLPIADNLELTAEHAREHDAGEAFVAAIRMVRDELAGVLQKFGVTPITAVGVPFDPQRHEAIAHLPTGDQPEGTVVAQARRGYLLHDMLLRPAQVVVAAQPQTLEAGGAPAANGTAAS